MPGAPAERARNRAGLAFAHREEAVVKLAWVLWASCWLALAGCGSSGPELGTLGAYGGPCHEDGSCNAGLHCVNHVCEDK